MSTISHPMIFPGVSRGTKQVRSDNEDAYFANKQMVSVKKADFVEAELECHDGGHSSAVCIKRVHHESFQNALVKFLKIPDVNIHITTTKNKLQHFMNYQNFDRKQMQNQKRNTYSKC
ncbi:hypothetical protein L6452_00172 [Arctium lappa]|uniref:Uncharacterized protein n=1 Tax=Arctium lappa TaxID=4217 RepID=A0ACB9FEE8_ARCLA|nr:hypothetical protein L6452_00172 [Arctium lappa]